MLIASAHTKQGGACPDGYTCLCRPCEPLPDEEFSFSLRASGQPVGTGACEKMVTCASEILAYSNLTLLVVDNWGPAREVFVAEELMHLARQIDTI